MPNSKTSSSPVTDNTPWPPEQHCPPVACSMGRCSSHCCHMNRDSPCCLGTGISLLSLDGTDSDSTRTFTTPHYPRLGFIFPNPEENRTVRLGRHLRVLLQVTKTLDPLLQQCQHTNFKNFSHSCGQSGNLEAALNDSRVTGRNLSRADISDRATEHPGTQLQCQQTVAVTFWRVSVTTHNSIFMENYWCLLHLKPWNTSPPHEGVLNC